MFNLKCRRNIITNLQKCIQVPIQLYVSEVFEMFKNVCYNNYV